MSAYANFLSRMWHQSDEVRETQGKVTKMYLFFKWNNIDNVKLKILSLLSHPLLRTKSSSKFTETYLPKNIYEIYYYSQKSSNNPEKLQTWGEPREEIGESGNILHR